MKKGYKGIGMEGSIARWYEKTTRRDMEEYVALARRIDVMLPGGSNVLEIAPGPGFTSVELARMGRYRVTGLDISRTMIALARKNAAAAGVDVEFLEGDASKLPFVDDSFDFVVCRAAFKNFTEPVKAIQEMHRVLRPGAQGMIADLRRGAPMSEIATYVDRSRMGVVNGLLTKATFRFMLLPRAYTPDQFQQMLTQVPFTHSRIEQVNIGLEAWFQK